MPEIDLPFDIKNLPDPDFVIPDLTECVEGWRSWKVQGELPRHGRPPHLISPQQNDYVWTPRQVFEATCGKDPSCSSPTGPGIPGETCRCGLYSAKTRDHLMSMSYHRYDGERSGWYCVVGQVANWGKVIEGSLGWRSQYSYPVKLYVPYEIWRLCKPLEMAYGCPTELDNFLSPRVTPEW